METRFPGLHNFQKNRKIPCALVKGPRSMRSETRREERFSSSD